jgi:hypothetical protein
MKFSELYDIAKYADRTTFVNAVRDYIAALSIRNAILCKITDAEVEYVNMSEEYRRGVIIGIIMQMYFNEYKEYPT